MDARDADLAYLVIYTNVAWYGFVRWFSSVLKLLEASPNVDSTNVGAYFVWDGQSVTGRIYVLPKHRDLSTVPTNVDITLPYVALVW